MITALSLEGMVSAVSAEILPEGYGREDFDVTLMASGMEAITTASGICDMTIMYIASMTTEDNSMSSEGVAEFLENIWEWIVSACTKIMDGIKKFMAGFMAAIKALVGGESARAAEEKLKEAEAEELKAAEKAIQDELDAEAAAAGEESRGIDPGQALAIASLVAASGVKIYGFVTKYNKAREKFESKTDDASFAGFIGTLKKESAVLVAANKKERFALFKPKKLIKKGVADAVIRKTLGEHAATFDKIESGSKKGLVGLNIFSRGLVKQSKRKFRGDRNAENRYKVWASFSASMTKDVSSVANDMTAAANGYGNSISKVAGLKVKAAGMVGKKKVKANPEAAVLRKPKKK